MVASAPVAEVGKLARRGALWSVLQVAMRNLLSIGSTAVLARLLSPDDYGLMGMVGTLTVFLLVFSDMGLSWATVQRKALTQAQVSNLFWINGVAGAGLWLACILVAPMVADFYGRAELAAVTTVMGATFLLSGLAAQPFALLSRRMDFRRVAIIEMLALAVSASLAIVAAMLGWGYWSLVVQALAGQLTRLGLAMPASGLVIQRPVRGIGTRSLARFGGLLALNGLLIYVARNLDNVLIGKYWGTQELGYYGRAYFLMLLPSTLATGALAGLMVPALSAFQNDSARLGAAFRRAVRLVAFVGCPMAAGLALTATEAVRLVYGEAWSPVAPMLMWLSIAGLSQPIYNTTGWLFTATGRARAYFGLTLINGFVLAGVFLWAAPRGALAVSMAYGLVMGIVLLLPSLWTAHRAAGIRLRHTLADLWPVLLAVLIMAAAVYGAGVVMDWARMDWRSTLAAKVAVGVLTYLVAARCLLVRMLNDDLIRMLPARFAVRLRRALLLEREGLK